MGMKGVMSVENDTTQMKDTITETTLTDYTMNSENSRPEGITEQDEQDEIMAKFWADYGESLWVDPMEQEWMWDEKNFN